jgi:hypothetical protein
MSFNVDEYKSEIKIQKTIKIIDINNLLCEYFGQNRCIYQHPSDKI